MLAFLMYIKFTLKTYDMYNYYILNALFYQLMSYKK